MIKMLTVVIVTSVQQAFYFPVSEKKKSCRYPEGMDQWATSQLLRVHTACVVEWSTRALPGLNVQATFALPLPLPHLLNKMGKQFTSSFAIGADLMLSSRGRAQCVWMNESKGHSVDLMRSLLSSAEESISHM